MGTAKEDWSTFGTGSRRDELCQECPTVCSCLADSIWAGTASLHRAVTICTIATGNASLIGMSNDPRFKTWQASAVCRYVEAD